MIPGRVLARYLTLFVRQLVRSGLTDAVICPGSRSAPLALTIAEDARITPWVLLDERSAAYFALGLAKGTKRPVALVSTSGTAAANFLPAVVEAQLSRVPLIVLTADRPRELRDVGAPQTIDQIHLYGSHVKWFVDMPTPSNNDMVFRYAKTAASRAAALAMAAPAGPVHLNFPLREPLIPEFDPPAEVKNAALSVFPARPEADHGAVKEVADALSDNRPGIVVVGPGDFIGLAPVLDRFSQATGWPILADPLSNLRGRGPYITGYDAFLRHPAIRLKLSPQWVIRLGASPTSKVLNQLIAKSDTIMIDSGLGYRDPNLLPGLVIDGDPLSVLSRVIEQLTPHPPNPDWMAKWRRAQAQAEHGLKQFFSEPRETFEGSLFSRLPGILAGPGPLPVLVGNSMPIRDLDSFCLTGADHLEFYGNRGANGIDGLVSTGLGLSAALGRSALILGDLAFYHDMNGLLAARRFSLDAFILVINNDGGGIFSFLPVADLDPARFELLFGTPHHLRFGAAADLYGGRFTAAATIQDIAQAARHWQAEGGLAIVEWTPLAREDNVRLHQQAWQHIGPWEG